MKIGSKKKIKFNLSYELEKATRFHQNGHFQQAKVTYKKIIQHAPKHPEALHMLGVLYSQTGEFEKAIKLMCKSIKSAAVRPDYLFNLARAYYDGKYFDDAIKTFQKYFDFIPDDPEAFYWMGRALSDKKDLGQAISYYQKALEKTPDRIDYLNSLGLAFYELDDFEQALICYKQALKIQPNDFIVLNNLGLSFLKKGRLDEATDNFNKALAVNPEYVEAHFNLGLVHSEKEFFADAASCFWRASSLRPKYAEAHYYLGRSYLEQELYVDADDSFRNALTVRPEYAEAHYLLGHTLFKQNLLAEAINSLHQALSIKPDYPDPYVDLGRIYTIQGDLDKVGSCCEKALSIDPDHTGGLLLLACIRKEGLEDEILLRQENYFLKNELKNQQKIELAFALGKAYADRGNHDKAFYYLSEGNRLKRESFEYSISEDKRLFKLIKQVYSESYILKHADEGNQNETPVFILGMPRSGTSLIEQILASHPEVHGAGELDDIKQIIVKLSGCSSLAELITKISNIDSKFHEKVAAQYLSRLRVHSATARFITDKMPHNFLFIGAICLALPNAKIIHCVREPMDNCFSIYKNFISEKHKYAFDQQELAQYYLMYQDLMLHWHTIFSGRIYDIKYENMISNQEIETRKLLEHCGLSWDDHCLSFYETQRNVSTLSWDQVRKPIYNDSVQLWKKYKNHLGPMRSILLPKKR